MQTHTHGRTHARTEIKFIRLSRECFCFSCCCLFFFRSSSSRVWASHQNPIDDKRHHQHIYACIPITHTAYIHTCLFVYCLRALKTNKSRSLTFLAAWKASVWFADSLYERHLNGSTIICDSRLASLRRSSKTVVTEPQLKSSRQK